MYRWRELRGRGKEEIREDGGMGRWRNGEMEERGSRKR